MTNSAHSCACPAPREAGSVPVSPRLRLILAIVFAVAAWASARALSVELPDRLAAIILDVSDEEACTLQLTEENALRALDIMNANRIEKPDANVVQRYRRMVKEGFAKVYCDSRMTNRCVYVFLRTFCCDVAARKFQYDMLELKKKIPSDGDGRGRMSEGCTIGSGAVWEKERPDRTIRK